MKRQAWLLLCCLVCLLAGLDTASAAQLASDLDYCKVSSLPLDTSNSLATIRLSQTALVRINREYATAGIDLASLSSVSIDRVVVIVEYLDASDRVVLRIPFYATSTDEKSFQPPFSLPLPQHLDKVLEPGERIGLVGDSPLVSLFCPTKARVIFERVWLSDGKQEGVSSSLDLDVLPDVLPSYFDSTGCELSWPVDVLVRLKIKRSGEASVASIEGETKGLLACILRELPLWTFSPALRAGTPVESEVQVFLRFHSRDALPTDDAASKLLRKSASSSLTVVHIFPMDDNGDHWSIFFAGNCCARISRSRRLYGER